MSGLLDRIHANLVGLNMPRALETLADIVQRLERGEIGALEAIDALLAEELDIRGEPPRRRRPQDRQAEPAEDARELRLLLPAVPRPGPRPDARPARLRRPRRGGPSARPARHRQEPSRRRARHRRRQGPKRASTARPSRNSSRPSPRPGAEDRLAEKIRFFTRTSLLIVDEIGYVTIDGGAANLFFQLVNARYGKGAMILTSNRGFAEWGELFGDPVVATALLDRLLHHAVVIHIEGASYRLREHTDLIPEHVRANAPISPPPPPRRRGRPPRNKQQNTDVRR